MTAIKASKEEYIAMTKEMEALAQRICWIIAASPIHHFKFEYV